MHASRNVIYDYVTTKDKVIFRIQSGHPGMWWWFRFKVYAWPILKMMIYMYIMHM
jgi:hypothetical protein